jgi:hypothetical protein
MSMLKGHGFSLSECTFVTYGLFKLRPRSSLYLYMAVHPSGPWPLVQFLNNIDSR